MDYRCALGCWPLYSTASECAVDAAWMRNVRLVCRVTDAGSRAVTMQAVKSSEYVPKGLLNVLAKSGIQVSRQAT
jgi:hypothetical protein